MPLCYDIWPDIILSASRLGFLIQARLLKNDTLKIQSKATERELIEWFCYHFSAFSSCLLGINREPDPRAYSNKMQCALNFTLKRKVSQQNAWFQYYFYFYHSEAVTSISTSKLQRSCFSTFIAFNLDFCVKLWVHTSANLMLKTAFPQSAHLPPDQLQKQS